MPSATFSNQLDQGNYQGVEVRSSSELTLNFIYSSWADVRLFEAIDWIIYLTARGTVTRLDFLIQFSIEISPNETTDWTTLQVEDIASTGISTLNDYELRRTISDVITLGISSPVRGRWMRLGIRAGAGGIANSLCSIDVYRRKPKTL